jgi:hypothetical protein
MLPSSSFSALRISAWSGVAVLVVSLGGFLIAGVLPLPLGPSDSRADVVSFYTEDNTRVTAGLVIATLGIALVMPLLAAISVHMLRMEGRVPILTFIQLGVGAVTAVLLLIPLLLMAVIAFAAPDRMSPETIRSLNDVAWLLFITPIVPFMIQNIAIGFAIINDPHEIFPRWLGFLNFFIAFSFVPDPLAYFFGSGPFAWNGVFVFWLALTTYALFLVAMCWAVLRANNQMRPTASQPEALAQETPA